jgi:outer membrane protein OmpA-like peptidoglycan-associated protein
VHSSDSTEARRPTCSSRAARNSTNWLRTGKAYLTIESITLVGHADRLGNADYNLRLSRQRAETVKEYLGARGIAAPMVARGVGASRPLVACNADRSTGALKSCLQANRRVEIVVRGVRR